MASNTKYHVEKVTCIKENCQKTFPIILTPIYSAVTSPTPELQIKEMNDTISTDTAGEIDDYIVVKCPCSVGHQQRIYLKNKR